LEGALRAAKTRKQRTNGITAYHAKYFGYELTRQSASEGLERLSGSLFDALVDLNPHQIEAALFAMRSPLSHGVIFADEVGLGKTIEAGLVLCQRWAEHKRRLLVICPASIRKQWALELQEKFNLPVLILDRKTSSELTRTGVAEPFEAQAVVICSMNYAARMAESIEAIRWDLAVIDEAHKLRNVYRPSNKTGQAIARAVREAPKLLLTATPLQNSLLELYGLSTIIDENYFGGLDAFREQYAGRAADLKDLRLRLAPLVQRTLRNQVNEFIKYTERRAMTFPFVPTVDEQKLYDAISSYLLRKDTYGIPKRQRLLVTLILRKLLASSSRAIAGTLDTIEQRLRDMEAGLPVPNSIAERLIEGEELEDLIDEEPTEEQQWDDNSVDTPNPEVDRARLHAEIAEIGQYARWARGVGVDTKTRTLLVALRNGFAQMDRVGAQHRALIFTESRRTQDYVKDFLEANGFAGKVIRFNGSNSGPEERAIYNRWVEVNAPLGRSSANRAIDSRLSLIDEFRDHAEIMVATEAGAEGVNLQFCSLVINYDLPWNPQRVEQRIGRCHRYGQKHDVVVVNFFNQKNEADKRVLELLEQKFSLFSGVFGASDEILGTVESGVDFERRILDIYQSCRTPAEIDAAFDALQEELEETIKARMDDARHKLLENFDEDVHARLRVNLGKAREQLDRVGKLFWDLTHFGLESYAAFDDRALSFDLRQSPVAGVVPGIYALISKDKPNIAGDFLYRLSHPLGEYCVQQGKSCPTPAAQLTFDVSHHGAHIAMLETLKSHAGWLVLEHLGIDSLQHEDHLLFSAIDDDGQGLEQETCERMFRCTARVSSMTDPVAEEEHLQAEVDQHAHATLQRSMEQNDRYSQEEQDRLDRWAQDQELAAEQVIRETKAQIRALERQARQATTVEEKHSLEERVAQLEEKKRRQRRDIFDVEDAIKEKRTQLIEALRRRMDQKTTRRELFRVRWRVE
jgi:superfamily II DNA/RNA helicase